MSFTTETVPCAPQCSGTGESGTAAKYRVAKSRPHNDWHAEDSEVEGEERFSECAIKKKEKKTQVEKGGKLVTT